MSIKEQGWYLKQKQERLEQEIEPLREDVRRMEAMQRAITELQDERDEWKRRCMKAVDDLYLQGGYLEEASEWFKGEE